MDRKTYKQLDAWWRAANYLSAGQLYLLEDPLLKEPLTRDKIKRVHDTKIPLVVSMLLKKSVSDSRRVIATAYTETRWEPGGDFYIYLPSFGDKGSLTWSAYSMTQSPDPFGQYYLIREIST